MTNVLARSGVLHPPATERLVEGHLIRELRLTQGHERLLGGVERALGIERGQVAVDSGPEARFRELVGLTDRPIVVSIPTWK
jgi:hypothetical protein